MAHVRVLRSQGLFANCQGTLMERIGFGVAPLVIVEQRQVDETVGHVRVLRPQGLFADRQGALKERFGFGVTTLSHIEPRQVGETEG